jgi:hypothetical protein
LFLFLALAGAMIASSHVTVNPNPAATWPAAGDCLFVLVYLLIFFFRK